MSITALTVLIPILGLIVGILFITITNRIKTITTHFVIMLHLKQTLEKPMSLELRKEYESKIIAGQHRHYFLVAGLVFYCILFSLTMATILKFCIPHLN